MSARHFFSSVGVSVCVWRRGKEEEEGAPLLPPPFLLLPLMAFHPLRPHPPLVPRPAHPHTSRILPFSLSFLSRLEVLFKCPPAAAERVGSMERKEGINSLTPKFTSSSSFSSFMGGAGLPSETKLLVRHNSWSAHNGGTERATGWKSQGPIKCP